MNDKETLKQEGAEFYYFENYHVANLYLQDANRDSSFDGYIYWEGANWYTKETEGVRSGEIFYNLISCNQFIKNFQEKIDYYNKHIIEKKD